MKKVVSIVLMLVIASATGIYAQVTIGSLESPVNGAILQIKSIDDAESDGGVNADKGVGFPRVGLVKKDQLQPMYNESDAASLTEAQKKAHKGLVVFNINDIESEDLVPGLNFWDGEKWIAVSETQKIAQVSVVCGKIRVYGQYYKGVPLNDTHYIILPVTVTKKGDYSIIATGNNGYYFQASGTFENTGNFEVKLTPMGTPAQNGTNTIVFNCNNQEIASDCEVKITVSTLAMAYNIDYCDSIKVFGLYQTRHNMVATENYVEIPIDVIQDGQTSFETPQNNGIKFSVNYNITAVGPQILTLVASGVPKQEGTFTYTFTTDGAIKNTCSFKVSFFSTLGEFSDPACKCMDIYDERPSVANGEYWLVDCITTEDSAPVKTLCDIENGGWTLLWSFSEKTDYSTYVQNTTAGGTGNNNSMVIAGSYWGVNYDRPTNRVTTEGGTINYANFRLSRDEWLHFPNSAAKLQLKVRITENPKKMDDKWALNNYGIISPRNQADNPILSTYDGRGHVPATGKLFGKRWEVITTSNGNYGGWDEVSGNRYITLYNNDTYCTHWNWSNLGSNTQFQVVPNLTNSDIANDNSIAMSNMNNIFGWFGETQPNHHFGKCGGVSGDDYKFTTKTCLGSGMVPHSLNSGEGRYLQWFVK
jgi:hypothetical protein